MHERSSFISHLNGGSRTFLVRSISSCFLGREVLISNLAYKAMRVPLLIIAMALSPMARAVLCGALPAAKQEAMDCCQSMQGACHHANGLSRCCLQRASAPVLGSFIPSSRIRAATSLLPIAVLLPPSGLARSNYHGPAFAASMTVGHSPPSSTPLFVLRI
jgi:hypothetical protein